MKDWLAHTTPWRGLALACAVSLWVLGLWPAQDLNGAGFINDKVAHFIGYLALGGLLRWGWPARSLPMLWLLAFACGVGVEVAQGFTADRAFELTDMLANGLGALTGLWLGHYWSPYRG